MTTNNLKVLSQHCEYIFLLSQLSNKSNTEVLKLDPEVHCSHRASCITSGMMHSSIDVRLSFQSTLKFLKLYEACHITSLTVAYISRVLH